MSDGVRWSPDGLSVEEVRVRVDDGSGEVALWAVGRPMDVDELRVWRREWAADLDADDGRSEDFSTYVVERQRREGDLRPGGRSSEAPA